MSRNKIVQVGLVQMSCHEDRSKNFDKAEKLVKQCVQRGADLVCLQELSFDPYFCQTEDHDRFSLAEPLNGEIAEFSSRLERGNALVLLAGLFERRAAGVYHNSCLVFERDGCLLDVYRKTHIPDDPSFLEKFYFTPGDNAFPAIETSVGRIGICICWDQWYPEAARLTAMDGAEILFFPTAIGWLHAEKADFGDSQHAAWQTMMRSHAIANGIYVVAPNRVGIEDSIEFWGSSFVCDPYGSVLVQMSSSRDEVDVQKLDLSMIETARTHWPFFRDRRIDLYQDLAKRWRESQD